MRRSRRQPEYQAPPTSDYTSTHTGTTYPSSAGQPPMTNYNQSGAGYPTTFNNKVYEYVVRYSFIRATEECGDLNTIFMIVIARTTPPHSRNTQALSRLLLLSALPCMAVLTICTDHPPGSRDIQVFPNFEDIECTSSDIPTFLHFCFVFGSFYPAPRTLYTSSPYLFVLWIVSWWMDGWLVDLIQVNMCRQYLSQHY